MMKPEECFALDNALSVYNPTKSYQEIVGGLKQGNEPVILWQPFMRFPNDDVITLMNQMKVNATSLLTPYRAAIQTMLDALKAADPDKYQTIIVQYQHLGEE